jgi:MerR HTH family regulatory protein
MQTEHLIPAREFCASHNIEISFIRSLQESGLIEIATIQEAGFIHTDQLQQLEKIVRLYYEMDINLEGIETITHLLQRVNSMQDEIILLKNKLRFYETNG